jgi:sRNA-binding carbon storage regulator CsrA
MPFLLFLRKKNKTVMIEDNVGIFTFFERKKNKTVLIEDNVGVSLSSIMRMKTLLFHPKNSNKFFIHVSL